MKRREFIGLVGGAAAWPIATRAQQDTRVRLVAVLSAGSKGNTAQRQAVFVNTLLQLGCVEQCSSAPCLRRDCVIEVPCANAALSPPARR